MVGDEFDEDYRLGSVEEIRVYSATDISLSGRLLPAMQVRVYTKDPTNYFYVRSGFSFGWASNKKVRAYLDAVSRNLELSWLMMQKEYNQFKKN